MPRYIISRIYLFNPDGQPHPHNFAERQPSMQPMVPYFFISQEKFNFAHFLEKIELVSKNAVFFSGAGKKNSLLRLSQSVRFKLFQEKKKQIKKKTTFGKKKKKQNQNLKNGGKNGKLVP